MSDFCYIDHATGESDHMNGHIRTSKCDKPREATVSAPVTYTREQIAEWAEELERCAGLVGMSLSTSFLRKTIAMLRQAAAEGQGNEADRLHAAICQAVVLMNNGTQPFGVEAHAILREALAATPTEPTKGKHSDACCELTYREMDQRCICAATPTEPTPPPVPSCGTCKHFGTAVGLVEPLVGHCSRNHSYGWPADGSGYCHLHPDAPPVTGGDR